VTLPDFREEMRQERLKNWADGGTARDQRGSMLIALTSLRGENPWIPGAAFVKYPELKGLLIEFLESKFTEVSDGV